MSSTEPTVDELEQQLAAITDPREKIEKLVEMRKQVKAEKKMMHPELEYQYVKRALEIAEQIQSKEYIAKLLYVSASIERYVPSTSYDAILANLERAVSLFEEIGDEVYVANSRVMMAEYYTQKGDYGIAKNILGQVVEVFKRGNRKSAYAGVVYIMGKINSSMGNNKEALEKFLEALQLYTELSNDHGKSCCYNGIGGVYNAIGEPQRAIEFSEKAVQISKNLGNRLTEALGVASIGNMYLDLRQFSKALENFQYALKIFRELHFPNREAIAWMQIGDVYEDIQEYAKALSCYRKAEKLLQKADDKECIPSLYRGISSVYSKQKRWKMAKRYGEKALQEAENMERLSEQHVLHQQMSEICEQLGELPEALMHHKRYAELREEVLGTEKQKAIAEMQAKFDVESAEREKELFRVKNVELTAALEEVQRLNDRLTKLNTEKNEVLGVVAHDLQGPLSGVKLVAEMVQAHYKQMPDVELQHQLGTIAQTSERMLLIATALLQAQALEQQEVGSEQRARVDVGEEVRLAIERFRASAYRKGIELERSVPSGAVEVECDRSGLQQVLENLLSNGIKFSPHGKRVGIEVKLRGGRVQIGVWDEGPGISAKDKRRLFGKFARLSAVPTGGESSTGLGLWIVKQRVTQLGGSIRCISKVGAGARFVVELPQQAEAL